MKNRTKTNVILNILLLASFPVFLLSLISFIGFYMALLFLILCFLYGLRVPYLINKKGSWFFKFSPFLPASPVKDVHIDNGIVMINKKSRLVYRLDKDMVLEIIEKEIKKLK